MPLLEPMSLFQRKQGSELIVVVNTLHVGSVCLDGFRNTHFIFLFSDLMGQPLSVESMRTGHPSVQPKAKNPTSKFIAHSKAPEPASTFFFFQTMPLGTIRRLLRTLS
jgi:hypothetical protein